MLPYQRRLLLPLAVLLCLGSFPVISSYAQTQNQSFNATQSEVLSAPKQLSGDDLAKALNLAKSDPRFQQLVGEKPYQYESYDFLGNVSEHPTKWYPEIRFSVAGKDQVIAVIDLQAGVVRDVKYMPGVNVKIGSPSTTGENNNDTSGTSTQDFGWIALIAGIAAAIVGIGVASYYLVLARSKRRKAELQK